MQTPEQSLQAEVAGASGIHPGIQETTSQGEKPAAWEGHMLGCWRSERQWPSRGAQTGHGDGGGCEGLEMGQAVPLTVPRRRREKRAGACWGLEEEEVKKPGSRGQGNVCPSGGRKGRVHGAAGDEGRRLLPWQWCGAFRKDMAFLLRLLSQQARRRPEKLRLGQGCLLGPPEHLSPGISRLCLTGTFCPGPSIPLGLDTKTCVWRPEPGPSPA